MKRRRMSMSLETDVSLNNTGENDLTLNDDEITNSVNQEEALKENKNLKEIDQISDWKENCEKVKYIYIKFIWIINLHKFLIDD